MKLFKKNRDWCHVFPKLDNYLTSAKRTKEKIAKGKQRKRKKELAAKAALRKLQRKRKKRKKTNLFHAMPTLSFKNIQQDNVLKVSYSRSRRVVYANTNPGAAVFKTLTERNRLALQLYKIY
mgnify:CR=1 FL=1